MSVLKPFFRTSDPRMKMPTRVGVRFRVVKARMARGRIALRRVFEVRTTQGGKTSYRRFSIDKLGMETAWRLAVRHREAFEQRIAQTQQALAPYRREHRHRRVAVWLEGKSAAYRQAHTRQYNERHRVALKQRRQQKRKEGR